MKVGARLSGMGRSVASMASHNVADGLLLAGAAAVSYGAWLMYPPAGFIVGGVLAMVAGALIARGA